MGQNNAQRNILQVAYLAALSLILPVRNIMRYDSVFNFSDFGSDEDVPNIRYLKSYVDANFGTGGSGAASIPLPVKTASNLIQDGFDWYLDLSGAGLPATPQLSVYVSNAGDGSDTQSLPTNYRPYNSRLYGFNDPAVSPNQKIYISYIGIGTGTTTGGGTTAPSGTITSLTIKNQDTGGYVNATLTGSGPDEGWSFAESSATSGTDYISITNADTGLTVKATITGTGQNIGWSYE